MKTEILFSLQPLMDNLESQTYEVFEKDPIKYSQYQQVSLLNQIPPLLGRYKWWRVHSS